MKNFIIITLILFIAISNVTYSQSVDSGTFWVVETQRGVKYSQIKIYDNDLNLLHIHELPGKKLNSTKRRDKQYINQIHQSYLAWHRPTIWHGQKAQVIRR